MPKLLKEEITDIRKLSHDIYLMSIRSEFTVSNAKPGQFVNIRCCEGINALLRRPISICSINAADGTFDIAFQVKGTGTGILAEKKPGDVIDIISPLGTPFDISGEFNKIAVVGGGIGVFPLLFLLQKKCNAERTVFLGFRNKEAAVMLEEFEASSEKLIISSDDGSVGRKGFITEEFENSLSLSLSLSLNSGNYDIVYACGPAPMLKKVAAAAAARGIRCQVSLEQRMGCGIGACLVCTCKIKKNDDWEYKFVCSDGPVFWADEVIFE